MEHDVTTTVQDIRAYWNERIHDLEMTSHPVGSPEFFEDLAAYRYDKLRYLPQIVRFDGYPGRTLLEVGCGIGTDLVRFASGGAIVTGLDLSETAIRLAEANVRQQHVAARLVVGDGERLPFPDGSFDVVYAHGVLQYTADAATMVRECHRVLRSGGEAIFMVYNRISWLNALSKVMRVPLEHEDAPVLERYSIAEFRHLLEPFGTSTIVPERFPVASRLHKGWKAAAFNYGFVGGFNALPRAWVRRFGWHLMAFCRR